MTNDTESKIADDLGTGTPHYLPSPEQIAAVCKIIQAGWSREEEQKRRAIPATAPVEWDWTGKFHGGA